MIPGTKPGARGALQRERWWHPWFERGGMKALLQFPVLKSPVSPRWCGDKDKEATPRSWGSWKKRNEGFTGGPGTPCSPEAPTSPLGPWEWKKGNVGGIVGTKHRWGQGWGTGGTAQGMGTPWEGRPALPWFPIFLFPPSLFSLSLPKTPSLGPALQGQPHLDPAGIPLESCWILLEKLTCAPCLPGSPRAPGRPLCP